MTISINQPVVISDEPAGKMKVTVSGAGPINTSLEITLDGATMASVTTDNYGNFTKEFVANKTPGGHTLRVKVASDPKSDMAMFTIPDTTSDSPPPAPEE